ncbi:MAG: HYR domain-containing protein [Nitrosopumilaceae archaeon]
MGLVVIFLSGTLIQYSEAQIQPKYLTQWGTQGLLKPGYFASPQSIAVDSVGQVYVTDLGNMRVQKFDNDGTYLYAWGMRGSGAGEFNGPSGIAVYENYVYVVDNQLNRIQKFDTIGHFVAKWGIAGQGEGQFLLPQGIAIGPDGSVYVTDTGNSRIQKFTSDGEFLLEFGSSGTEDGKFLSPRGIATDVDGNVYVSDPNSNRIQKFTDNGFLVGIFDSYSAGMIQSPQGIDVNSAGTIYVVDAINNRILMLDENGDTLTSWGAAGIGNSFFRTPLDITVDSNGNVFVVDTGNNRIQKFGSTNIENNETPVTLTNQEVEQTKTTSETTETTLNPVPGDFTKPIITTPNDITVEAIGPLTPVSIGQAMATDQSGIASLESNAPQQFPLGITTLIWTAIDGAGNVAIATQVITVIDTTPPTITSPGEVVVEATSITDNYVDLGNPTTSDSVGVISITNDAPDVFPLGETIVTWTATDVGGNLASTTQRVIVEDTTKPTIYTPDDIIFEATSLDLNEIILGEATVIDNGVIESITNDAPQFFGLGNTTVTWVAADSAGNIATASQLVTVVDTTAPSILVPEDIVFEATSLNDNIVSLGEPVTTDVQQVTIVNNAPVVFPFGETVVIWAAFDPEGNDSYDTQTILVVDTTPPTFQVPEDIVVEATGLENNVVVLGDAQAEDAIAVSSIVNDAPNSYPFGTTIVTWTATDTNENKISATQTVSVIDTTPPQIIPPKDIVAEATNIESNYVELGQPTITDIIGIKSVTNDAPASFPIGMTTITWSAVDTSGNTSTVTQIIIIGDTEKPSLSPPLDIVAEAESSEGATVAIGEAVATDVIEVAAVENNAPEIFPIGETIVTWTAMDIHGNISEVTQSVTVVDTTAPSLVPPNDLLFEAVNATQNTVFIGEPTVEDFVGVSSVENDAPDVFTVGETIVTWTATDAAGNSATSTQRINVVDTTPPTIIAPDDITSEATSEHENMINYGQAIADDLVGVVSISNDAPDVFQFGLTTITWTVTDAAGNSATSTQRIHIIDTTSPVLSVPEDIVAEATSADGRTLVIGEAITTDIITVASITNDAPDVFPLGETIVTWSTVDSSGNEITATQNITVIDTTSPTIIPPDDILVEATSLTANQVELGIVEGTDSVSEVSITNDAAKTFPFGETIVTWTATDAAGNSATATQKVTVIDTSPPKLAVPDDIIIDAYAPEISISIGVAEATDITDLSPIITNNAPEIFPLGETIVTWTVTDNLGNSITETQSVNVQACGRPTSYYNMIIGSAEDDTILGTNVSDLIFGLAGDDIIFGYKGNDCIIGGEGDDIIFGNEGNDSISGGEGNDILKGQSGEDEIVGEDGTDIIDGGDDYDSCNASEESSDDLVIKCEV